MTRSRKKSKRGCEIVVYFSCKKEGKFYPQKSRLGKYMTPRSGMFNPIPSREYLLEDFDIGDYGRETTYLEKAVFGWLNWAKRKKNTALTADQLARLTGTTKGPVLAAINNFTAGIISWERIHIPPPLVNAPGSTEQANFEKNWYYQCDQKKIWDKEPTVATALKFVINLQSRPWDLSLQRNAIIAVNHAEKVCMFKRKKEKGELTYIDEEPVKSNPNP